MINASKAGCELCQLVLDETKGSQRGFVTALDLDKSQIFVRVLDVRYDDEIRGTAMVIFYQSSPHDPLDIEALSTVLGICALPDDPASKVGFIRGELIKPELTDSAYFKAKKWIENCIHSHLRCRSSPDFFPTRVIDVGPPDGSEDPRLLVNRSLRAPWVALSHCWGGHISSATLRSNIEARTDALPMSHLPLNFRDAITITRKLGYRYLWIDALCILQDSQSDWQGHLSHMGEIYQYAVVTIAADVASDSDTGIILRRELSAKYVSVPYRSISHNTEGTVNFTPSLDNFPNGPIQTRGWTLQEDLLSVRTLYFSADQLLWQCQTTKISESDHDPPNGQGRHEDGLEGYLKRSFLLPDNHPASSLEEISPAPDFLNTTPSGQALDHWYLVVNEYVKRSLTVEQDRFPALYGIARQIERRTGYKYKAGMWLEDIHVGLMWTTNGTGLKRKNIACPSWSWAGVVFPGPGKSDLPYDMWSGPRSLTKMARTTSIHSKSLIEDITPGKLDKNATGDVKSGTLTIRGNFQTATDWLSRHSLPLLYKKGQRFDLSDLTVVRAYTYPFTDSPRIICELDYHQHWPDNWTDENRENFERGIAFLQIYRLAGHKDQDNYFDNRNYENMRIAYALILEPTDKEGQYRRRGMAEIPCEQEMADAGWEVRSVELI
ncbi:hypothetical protein IFR05_003229 [Cadophora sp. M221]|nr:hypothetical protein IFR05_003229 [Cadophora sp. M221]